MKRPKRPDTSPKRRNGPRLALALLGGSALAAAGWMSLIDPALNNWGASPSEQAGPLPGDAWMSLTESVSTRAIDIQAPPERVWPWLLQLGAGRGGFYTFDLIEMTRTQDHGPGRRLESAWQQLAPGDTVSLAKGLDLEVVLIEPERALVLGSRDPEPHAWSWAFVLVPGAGGCRLLVRERHGPGPAGLPLRALNRLVASIDNLMSWKMLHGIKARAESEQSSFRGARPGSALTGPGPGAATAPSGLAEAGADPDRER